jgi:nucleoside-diphosphate-sugar epimerase
MFLVTGATGFVGKNLVLELIKKQNIRVLVRRTSNISLFKKKKDIDIAYGDLEYNDGIESALDGIDVVIHCAARTIGRNFIEYYKTNTLGTLHLTRAMQHRHIRKLIYVSSHAACGPSTQRQSIDEATVPRPTSFYGVTKKLAEDIIMHSTIPYVILRPVSIYGPYDTEILKYMRLLNRGICPIVGCGEKYINLIYVADLIRMIITIIEHDTYNNRIYFLSDGNCYSMNEILDMVATILRKQHIKIRVPESLALSIGLLNDIFIPEKKRTIWRDKVKELTQSYWLCCNERSTKEFRFPPCHTVQAGMEETITWYRKHHLLS